jgi:2-alkenal reductase
METALGIEGVIVARTAPAGPAERAGIRGVDFASGGLGDVITEANDKPVRRLSDLTDEIEQIGTSRSIKLVVKRGSQSRDLNVDIVDIGRSQ